MEPFNFSLHPYDEEGLQTTTTKQQKETEASVLNAYGSFLYRHPNINNDQPLLYRSAHIKWLQANVVRLPSNIFSFCHTRPWTAFWTLHPLDLLDTSNIPLEPHSKSFFGSQITSTETTSDAQSINQSDSDNRGMWNEDLATKTFAFFRNLRSTDGGFSGDFGGAGHALTCYAAIMALLTVGARTGFLQEAFDIIDRNALRSFWLSLKITDPSDWNYGAFSTCAGGEVDTRAIYCILASADMLDMLDDDELTAGLVPWLLRCQGYDGGFSAFPGAETHGGYTFTAASSLYILGAGHLCDIDALERWTVTKQMEQEGGFCGRTLKLVDSCYSYWVGAVLPIVALCRQQGAVYTRESYKEFLLKQMNKTPEKTQEECSVITTDDDKNNDSEIDITKESNTSPSNKILTSPNKKISKLTSKFSVPVRYHATPKALGWTFNANALQAYILTCCQNSSGGFADKPQVPKDIYHSCYSLSGLATSQFAHNVPRLAGIPKEYKPTLHDIEMQLTKPITNPSQSSQFFLESIKTNTLSSESLQLSKTSPEITAIYAQASVVLPVTGHDTTVRPVLNTENLSETAQSLLSTYSQEQPVLYGSTSDVLQINNPLYNISQNAYAVVSKFLPKYDRPTKI